MALIDRRNGAVEGLAMKRACKSVTTANITLSGEQTINSVACVDGDRVLVKDQTTASQNGIYVVSTGNWERAKDADGAYDLETGCLVHVWGISTPTIYHLTTTGDITVDTTSLTFAAFVPQINYFVTAFVGGGVLDGSEVLCSHVFTQDVSFDAGLASSEARSGVAATAQAVLTIKKNSTSIGTITFAAAATTGTFAMSADQSFADGDKLEIIAPSSTDATLARLAITLVGNV